MKPLSVRGEVAIEPNKQKETLWHQGKGCSPQNANIFSRQEPPSHPVGGLDRSSIENVIFPKKKKENLPTSMSVLLIQESQESHLELVLVKHACTRCMYVYFVCRTTLIPRLLSLSAGRAFTQGKDFKKGKIQPIKSERHFPRASAPPAAG